MHRIIGQTFVAGDVKPVQFPDHARTAFVKPYDFSGMGQMLLHRLLHRRHLTCQFFTGGLDRAFGNVLRIQVMQGFAGTCQRQELVFMEVRHVRLEAWTILNRLRDALGKCRAGELVTTRAGFDFGLMFGHQ
jgi:hypothetical protein